MPEKQFEYALSFLSPVSVFTGLGIAGLVDRTVIRDSNGLPCIYGSTVKGRFRFYAERVLCSVATDGLKGLRIHDNELECKDLKNVCTLCRLFGNPAITPLVNIGQAFLVKDDADRHRRLLEDRRNPVVSPDADIRPGVSLSRLRRTALPDHLFFDETVPSASFTGMIQIDLQIEPEEFAFLKAVGHLVDALGARKASGRGRLKGGIVIVGDLT